MGNKDSKTHPADEEPHHIDYNYGYEHYDQHRDYDTNWHPDKDYGKPIYPAPGTDVIQKKRSCTDIPCLLLFIAFLCGWGSVAFYGLHNGNISKVIYPTDSQGNICGRGVFSDHRMLLMFDMTQCLNPAILVEGCLTPKVCVNRCPDESYSPLFNAETGKTSETEIKRRMKDFCRMDKMEEFNKFSVKKLVQEGICPPWYLQSSDILGYCLPINMHKDNETKKEVAENILTEKFFENDLTEVKDGIPEVI